MKKTISFSDFSSEFWNSSYKDRFSYEGLEILFNYLEEYEEATGEELELDVVAFSCDFYEATPMEIAKDYNIDLEEIEIEDGEILINKVIEKVKEWLEERGAFIGETPQGTIVYNYSIL